MIAARGGPLRGLVRQVDADVYTQFAGPWQWRTTFMVPDRYAWTIETAGVPNHYLFDGRAVRAFVGDGQVAEDVSRAAALRTHARFTAVTLLDALRLPGVLVGEAPAGPDASTVVRVTLADDASQYRLAFDERGLLVAASGPVDFAPFGKGELEARFGDFRRVQGLLLPFATEYRLGGAPFAAERVRVACPDPPGLDDASFREPEALPRCQD